MIKVYTLPKCTQCDQTKQYLKMHNMPFEEIKIATLDANAIEELKSQGHRQAPIVVDTQGNAWSGFDYGKLDAARAFLQGEK